MTYTYDVLLNFTDDNRLIEFFEWQKEDILEHIKKIPLIRISSKQMEELSNYNIIVDKSFLEKIKGITTLYKKTKDLEYATLISDLNKVIALEFNSRGEIISKSSLLLDEEEEIIEECCDLREINISYKVKDKNMKDLFLTRSEIKKKRYLLKEIENLYKSKNIDKITYLYEEIYNQKDNLSLEEKYIKLKTDLEEKYCKAHNNLYDIVRLSHTKK